MIERMNLEKDTKLLVGIVIAAIILAFLLNLEFFWKNIVYYFIDFRSPTAQQAKNFDQPQLIVEPDTVVIESLGIKAPLVYVNEVQETVFQKALAQGAVHYPGTALPGEVGNVYIFGHSSDNAWSKGNYKTVFALLPKVEIGTEIIISNSQGRVYKYFVTQSLVVKPDALEYLSQETNGKKLLTLQTSYPIGTSLKRWVVVAELIER